MTFRANAQLVLGPALTPHHSYLPLNLLAQQERVLAQRPQVLARVPVSRR